MVIRRRSIWARRKNTIDVDCIPMRCAEGHSYALGSFFLFGQQFFRFPCSPDQLQIHYAQEVGEVVVVVQVVLGIEVLGAESSSTKAVWRCVGQ